MCYKKVSRKIDDCLITDLQTATAMPITTQLIESATAQIIQNMLTAYRDVSIDAEFGALASYSLVRSRSKSLAWYEMTF